MPNVQQVVDRFDRFQQAHAWAGFPLAVAKKFGEDQAGNLAALVAYYGFFALFPLLLALVTVLGFVLAGNPELQARIVDSALANFPVIGNQLRDNVGSLNGSGIALAVGLGGLAWAGLGAMQALQNAMNGVWNVAMRDRPGFVQGRLRGVLMLAVLGGGVVLTTALVGVGAGLSWLGPLARIVGFGLSLALNTGLFLVAFKVLPEAEVEWRQLIPGAVVAAVAWVLLQALGGFYVSNRLQGASQTYGVFAVVIGLLSWIYLLAQATLFAAELNVVRARKLWPRRLGTNGDLTDADRRALTGSAKVEERIPEQTVDVELPEPAS